MKILYSILLLFTNCLFAQLPPITSTTSLSNPDIDPNFCSDGNYAQDTANERDQYVGTWEYSQNGTLFQVKIEKKDQSLNKVEVNGTILCYTYCDEVTFKYKLVKNGIIIHDNLNQTTYNDPYIPTAIKKGTSDDLYGSFRDMANNVMGRVSIKRLNTSPPKITFNLSTGAYYLLNPDESYNPNQPLFSVPTGEIEMVKIN